MYLAKYVLRWLGSLFTGWKALEVADVSLELVSQNKVRAG